MKDSTSLTALHWAALNDDYRVVQYLLNHGANMQFSNYQQTPLDVAGTSINLQVRTLHQF
jgi:ankyrin repeat protein